MRIDYTHTNYEYVSNIFNIEPLEYLNNFEQYEMIKAKRGMIEQSHVPKLH